MVLDNFALFGDGVDLRFQLQTFATMTPSPRFTYSSSSSSRPLPSTSLCPASSSSAPIPPTPYDATIQLLAKSARVPTPGLHSSRHNSDTVRSGIHISTERVIDIDPVDPLEFDGICLFVDGGG
jgi:hypothetical protein